MHGAGINSEPRRNLAHPRSSRLGESGADGGFRLSRDGWAAQTLAFTPRPRQASPHTLLNHCALEFSEHAHHLKHRLAGRRRRIETLLMQE